MSTFLSNTQKQKIIPSEHSQVPISLLFFDQFSQRNLLFNQKIKFLTINFRMYGYPITILAVIEPNKWKEISKVPLILEISFDLPRHRGTDTNEYVEVLLTMFESETNEVDWKRKTNGLWKNTTHYLQRLMITIIVDPRLLHNYDWNHGWTFVVW